MTFEKVAESFDMKRKVWYVVVVFFVIFSVFLVLFVAFLLFNSVEHCRMHKTFFCSFSMCNVVFKRTSQFTPIPFYAHKVLNMGYLSLYSKKILKVFHSRGKFCEALPCIRIRFYRGFHFVSFLISVCLREYGRTEKV